MTKEELKKFNGQDGQPAYIGYKGKVYDMTKSDFWEKGKHMGIIFAGEDLTDKIGRAPHGEDNIFRFPVIDDLIDDNAEADSANKTKETIAHNAETIMSEIDQKKIARINWYKKNHPHPITVHFPIAFSFLAFLLQVFSMLVPAKVSLFSSSSLFISILSTLFLIPTIISGLTSFYINYNGFANKLMKRKILGTAVLMVTSIISVIVGAAEFTNGFEKNLQEVCGNLTEYNAMKSFYTLLTLFNAALAAFIGKQGGKITWPENK